MLEMLARISFELLVEFSAAEAECRNHCPQRKICRTLLAVAAKAMEDFVA